MRQETQPLKFTCYICGAENSYPIKEDQAKKGGKTVVKRCTNCSTENKIELPDGWIAVRTEVIHRGMKNTGDLT